MKITRILFAAAAGTMLLMTQFVGAADQKESFQKARICIMDFTMPDIIGQQRFLNSEHKQVRIAPACSLSNADRVSINSVMQGYVGIIDARDVTATNSANRALQLDDNQFRRTKDLELYTTITKGEARPMLLGADYLAAYLGKHPDVFTTMNQKIMIAAMQKLQNAPDFPKDFMLRLAQETGATHLIYGSIADVRSKLKAFKGYGIETKSIVYDLDVIIKVADLPAQNVIFSGVYTGVLTEQDLSTGGIELDGNKYQTLMKSAMEQAADDLYEKFAPGDRQQLKVTPIPPKKEADAKASAPAAAQPAPAPVAVTPAQPASVPAPVPALTSAVQPAPVPAPAPAPVPAPAGHMKPGEQDLPASAVQKKAERNVIRQSTAVVVGPDGVPVAPAPPVVTPVAAEGGTVIIDTGSRCRTGQQTVIINQEKAQPQAKPEAKKGK